MMVVWRAFLLPVVTATETQASGRASRMLESVTAWVIREKVAGLTFAHGEEDMSSWALYKVNSHAMLLIQ